VINMRVLFATGINNEVIKSFPSDWEYTFCGHRGVLTQVAEEYKPDVIILSDQLSGHTPLSKLYEQLWLKGFRVVLLLGQEDIPPTRAAMREAVKYGVFDFVCLPITPERVLDKILHPAKPEDIDADLRVQVDDDLAHKAVPDAPKTKKPLFGLKLPRKPKIAKPEPPKREPEPASIADLLPPEPEPEPPAAPVQEEPLARKISDLLPPESEGLDVVADLVPPEPEKPQAALPAASLRGLVAVVSPWTSQADPAVAAVTLAEYLAGQGRPTALMDMTGKVRDYVSGWPQQQRGKADVWLPNIASLEEAQVVMICCGQEPEQVPPEADHKLLVLDGYVSDFVKKTWSDMNLPGFHVLAEPDDPNRPFGLSCVTVPGLWARCAGVRQRAEARREQTHRERAQQEQARREQARQEQTKPEQVKQPRQARRPKARHRAEWREMGHALAEGYQAISTVIGYLISLPGLVIDFVTANIYHMVNLATIILLYMAAAYVLSTFYHIHLPGWIWVDHLVRKWGIV